jgi:hypothetical protein
MLAKNRRVYAGDFPSAYNGTREKHHVQTHKTASWRHLPLKQRTQPQPEEDLGGGDICSLQEQPSSDDDQPLD